MFVNVFYLQCPNFECKAIVPFNSWKEIADEDVAKQYASNARGLLAIRVSNCYCLMAIVLVTLLIVRAGLVFMYYGIGINVLV